MLHTAAAARGLRYRCRTCRHRCAPPPCQVKVLNSMSHPNLLRFHTWCAGAAGAAGAPSLQRACSRRWGRAAAVAAACVGAVHALPVPVRRPPPAPCRPPAKTLLTPRALPSRYETQNHLWVILEYCVGGDLLALLRSDGRLPEASGARCCSIG